MGMEIVAPGDVVGVAEEYLPGGRMLRLMRMVN